MLANELRQRYLEFFAQRGHVNLPSAPLIPIDALGVEDKSTLFTSAGMQQFMPFFLGKATPAHTRVTTVQKCVRTGDIESVGDYSHCTFFEMLGNFSFGDYFKSDVIPWTWEFLTKVVGLDPDRFCVTVYRDDEEAFRIWREVVGLPENRIHRLGEDKCYWPASVISKGPNQPCGPCSEVFYRVVPLEEMNSDPNLTPTERYLIDDDAGRWLEVWNNVFTQFDRSEDSAGTPILTPLPSKNNDTGAGFDRIACISQGKTSVFETDLFQPILARITELSGIEYAGTMSETDFAMRVVAEHTRSMVFCIADGILPDRVGRGYVLRYIMRRAMRFGKKALGFEEPFLHEIAPAIIEQMGGFYKELQERKEFILSQILLEETKFLRTLDVGIKQFERVIASPEVQATKMISGKDAFNLYDTHGFPVELTADIAKERGIQVDLEGFREETERQREIAKEGSALKKGLFLSSGEIAGADGKPLSPTEFFGYESNEGEAIVQGILLLKKTTSAHNGKEEIEIVRESVSEAEAGDEVEVILDETPFYGESGGQVGDRGHLFDLVFAENNGVLVHVADTKKSAGIFRHIGAVQSGVLKIGQRIYASVDAERRDGIRRNHTATHLMQAALQTVLGSHVHQKGSEVTENALRFDFTHTSPMTLAEVEQVEKIVNAEILRDDEVTIYQDLPIAEAKAKGAMALFGEKYGDTVRMIEIAEFSRELCGGTHVGRTSQIGLFKLIRETGVASGVRRIEAVTGQGAFDHVEKQQETLAQAEALLKSNPGNLLQSLEKLLARTQELEKQNRQLREGGAQAEELTAILINGVPVVTKAIENADAETLANLADKTAQRLGSAIIVLGSLSEGKVMFAAKVTSDLIAKGFHAGNIVREVAKIAGGGGGGRPDFAQAGGKNPEKLQEALDIVAGLIG